MELDKILEKAVELGASDIHLSAGYNPLARIDGDIVGIEDEVLTKEHAEKLVLASMKKEMQEHFLENLEADYAYELPNKLRFRVNAFMQYRGMSAAFRHVKSEIPTFEDILAPEVFQKISELDRGLVLVTGPTGSGKSTTLATMINHINHTAKKHVITIEDPIEYVYSKGSAVVNQRQLETHTKSFYAALRSALREDPDVILVGEMRDIETIRLALTAAETGHIVFSTLHTTTAASSISRIVDVFEGTEKAIISSILADSLQAVICQRLIRRADKGVVGAFEILLANPAVRNIIREGKLGQLISVMQTRVSDGMQTFDKAMDDLRAQKLIK